MLSLRKDRCSITSEEPCPSSRPACPRSLRAIGRIHHVAVIVRDIEESLAIYRDLLGLSVEVLLSVLPRSRRTV